MQCNNFELSIEVNGRNIREFGSAGRTYVEGRKNNRYHIKFRNNSSSRVLVVPTVDGLSVVDGNPHHDNSPGYVVQAYSSLTVQGWRTSLAEVREFEFGDKSGSVAGKTAGTQNVGVIGAMVFAEKPKFVFHAPTEHHHHHHYPMPVYPSGPITIRYADPGYTTCVDNTTGLVDMNATLKCSSGIPGNVGPAGAPGVSVMYCNSLGASNAPAPDFNLGTTYGQAIQDSVTKVDFEKGLCLATMEIYYSDRDGLLKAGIQVDKAPELASFPQAFGGFCKLPV
jgi:hypothetical protein